MQSLRFTVLAAGLICAGAKLAAETRPLELPSRYLVIPASEAATKRLSVGEDVLRVPLRWERAAVLDQAIEIAADDRRASLAKGQSLVETRLQFDDPAFASAAAFCVPRVADPLRKSPFLGMGLVGALIARAVTDSQFCLVDINRDGTAEHSVLVNGGSPAARKPVAITPTPYVLTPSAAVGDGDFFRIVYRGRNFFEMFVVQQGKARRFDTLTFTGPLGKETYRRLLRPEKLADGSFRFAAPGVTFTARNIDKTKDTVDLDWPGVASPVAFPIPDVVRESNGYSY